MEALFLFIGLAAGFIIAYLYSANKASSSLRTIESERDSLKTTLANINSETERRLSDKDEAYRKLVEAEKEHAAQTIEATKADMEKERQHFNQLREESERQWNEKFNTLKQEMQKQASEQLAAKQADLQTTNREQFNEMMKPIKEQFANFQKAVEESRTQNEVNKNQLKESFEAQMKLFVQQQNIAVSSLKEQTDRIGNDAANLTKALKGDSKVQGDWGEMILETILEQTGLRKNEEYFVQEVFRDEDNNMLRPDVVVKFPDSRSLVIDSKVSLTAYSQAVSTVDDTQREKYLNEHVRSVRKHVDELAAKNYSKIVDNSMEYVLMFIPNESSYISAMQRDAELHRYAYNKKIIIISSSNLLMTLQLAYNLWQSDRQNKNVTEVIRKATSLYEKVVGFQDDMLSIKTQLDKLNKTFDEANKKFSEGRGNILHTTETLKEIGINPKKQLKIETE